MLHHIFDPLYQETPYVSDHIHINLTFAFIFRIRLRVVECLITKVEKLWIMVSMKGSDMMEAGLLLLMVSVK